MSNVFGLSEDFYNVKAGADWPSWQNFCDTRLQDCDCEITEEIEQLITSDPKYHRQTLLKHKFWNIDTINCNFSQAWQDFFVLTMLNGKKNGTYVEIGSGMPVHISNTYLLYKFGYRGLNIDIDYWEGWDNFRPADNPIIEDFFSLDMNELLSDFPKQIDYLQVDIDPAESSLLALSNMLKTNHRFTTITFETDLFDNNSVVKEQAKELLVTQGYELVVENVAFENNKPFEDWYVDPGLIDSSILEKIKNTGSEYVLGCNIFCE